MATMRRRVILAAALAAAFAARAEAQGFIYKERSLPPELQILPAVADLEVRTVGSPVYPDLWTTRYPLTLTAGATLFLDFYSPAPTPAYTFRPLIGPGAKAMMVRQLEAFRLQRSAFSSLRIRAVRRSPVSTFGNWYGAGPGTSAEITAASPVLRTSSESNAGGLVRAVFWEDESRSIPGTLYQTYGYATLRRLREDGSTQDRDFYMLRSDPDGYYAAPSVSKAEAFASDVLIHRWLSFFYVENPMNSNGVRVVTQQTIWLN